MQILFEDQDLILVNKPARVLSQVSFDKTRVPVKELVEQERPDLKNSLYLHHRLDFETSGVFLMSKSKRANGPLTLMFQKHHFEKTYLCLTKPHQIQPQKKVQCEFLNDEKTEWIIKNYMAPAKGLVKHKSRMISVKSGGWAAETEFKILKQNEKFYLIQCKPKTGRTHQIRQHLQESQCSILGDQTYGGKSSLVPRLMLHAFSLEFHHPITQEKLKIEAPLPQDFLTVMESQS